MPYNIEKCTECGCGTYKVINAKTGHVYAKHTTLKKAKAQVRLLESAKSKTVEAPSIRALRNKPVNSDGMPFASHQSLNVITNRSAV